MIKHIWFDFSETICKLNKENNHALRYSAYAEVTARAVTPELIDEYKQLYEKYAHSNGAIFASLGLPANYWSNKINSVNPKELFDLMDDNIPTILEELHQRVPLSFFSNIKLDKILPAFNIRADWFQHFISSDMLKKPKPALEGFYKIIELTQLPADNILYIGDHVEKDILPAKQVGLKAGLVWSSSPEADYSFEKFADILKLFA